MLFANHLQLGVGNSKNNDSFACIKEKTVCLHMASYVAVSQEIYGLSGAVALNIADDYHQRELAFPVSLIFVLFALYALFIVFC